MSNTPAIILVDPQMGENIGASARAMLNFGLTDLRIVNPRDGWPNQAAIDMSAGALDKIEAKVFPTLVEAVKDMHFLFATTARPRGMEKPVFNPAEAIEKMGADFSNDMKTGFVFGPERAGLNNNDVALCHAILTIPVNPDFSSINLASSVLLVAYEWLTKNPTPSSRGELEGGGTLTPPAPHEKLDELLIRLETELQESGFFRSPDQKPTMLRNIRAMFMRGGLTEQEVRTFHGMLTALNNKK
ncbi:MAG: RNA methyltransferase [Alphaproteobacteria bacterium]